MRACSKPSPPAYSRAPARAVALGGIYYGLGCLAVTLLVAGTFYAYTVPVILILMAVAPGLFACLYARTAVAEKAAVAHADIRQVFRDFRSLGAVLFALLLFFQFGNEWSIAGWLPLFLVRRSGDEPAGLSGAAGPILDGAAGGQGGGGRDSAQGTAQPVAGGQRAGGPVWLLCYWRSTDNQFGAGAAVLLLGAGFASIYPLVAEKIGGRFPYYHPVFFSGIFSFALFGGLIAPATLGYAAAIWGIGIVVAVPLLGTCMVSALLAAHLAGIEGDGPLMGDRPTTRRALLLLCLALAAGRSRARQPGSPRFWMRLRWRARPFGASASSACERDRVLFERNADRLFLPASNAKLFTTALALVRLGPDYRFQTRVLADRTPGRGRVRGIAAAGGRRRSQSLGPRDSLSPGRARRRSLWRLSKIWPARLPHAACAA